MALREGWRDLPYADMLQEEQDRLNLEMYIWDVYKEINGIRPRWMHFSTMSDADLNTIADSLSNEVEEWNKRDEALRAELKAAREDPNGIVWLSTLGKMEEEYSGTVDPDQPDYWNWATKPALPPVTFGMLLGGMGVR